MWEYHGYVLQMSLDYNGGNEYPKQGKVRTLPLPYLTKAPPKGRQGRVQEEGPAPPVGAKMRAKWPFWPCVGRAHGQ